MKEILKNLVTTISLPEDTYLDQDAEILDIFVEELQDILAEFEHLFPLWLADADNEQYLKLQSEHIKERISKFGGKLYLQLQLLSPRYLVKLNQ